MERPHPGTLLVQGEEPAAARPVVSPIHRSTSFEVESAAALVRYHEGEAAFFYSRSESPGTQALERRLARLEGTDEAVLFGSGMAAVSTAVLALLSAGDTLTASRAIYGGSFRFFRDQLPRFGIGVRFVDPEALTDPSALAGSKLVWLETPVNPTLRVLDLTAVAAAARSAGVLTAVDATFATPLLLRPVEHGIDLVMHSATKYLNGHTDVLAGVLAGPKSLTERVRAMRTQLGGVLDPQGAYELGRGLATLEVRLMRQCASALRLAQALEKHPAVARVHHPGLPGHPDHALAARLMPAGTGGMLTLSLKGGAAAAASAFDRMRLFRRAPSLGGVESLVSIPVLTSHIGYSDEELAKAGVDRGMLRLSVGLEDPADLEKDLLQALA